MSSAGDNSGAAVGSSEKLDSKSNPESHPITIEEIMDGSKTESMSAAVIQKVPDELRRLKHSAYTPRFVSIGPVHSKSDRLQRRMQIIKRSYVNDLFDRISSEDRAPVLKRCQDEMNNLADEARKFYDADKGKLLTDDMLVIDGCFVLELLYRNHMNTTSDDPIYGSRLLRDGVQIDLLLLENQLPFFVLEKLFVLTKKARRNPLLKFYSIEQCVLKYFQNVNFLEYFHDENCSDQAYECKHSGSSKSTEKSFHHILHFLHERLILQNSTKDMGGEIVLMKSAQDLDFAGVKFRPRSSNCPFQVDFQDSRGIRYLFHRASFDIPTLHIKNSTEPVLRNLIAFEQCSPRAPSFVTSFAYLMDSLVNTAKDVEVLINAGVLKNYLAANEEVSDLFNKLCKEVVLGDFCFAKTCQKAVDYSELGWPEFMVYMKRNYFAKPWTFAAFVVASVAFGMTVVSFIRNLLR